LFARLGRHFVECVFDSTHKLFDLEFGRQKLTNRSVNRCKQFVSVEQLTHAIFFDDGKIGSFDAFVGCVPMLARQAFTSSTYRVVVASVA
jgi:hypothetical protein